MQTTGGIYDVIDYPVEKKVEVMNQKQTIIGAAPKMEDCANYIVDKYANDGYCAQRIRFEENGINGILVQIKNASTKGEGIFKTCLGMSSCATLKLRAEGSALSVEVMQGKWLDKVVVAVVSCFILWPLLITAAIGAFKQNKLLNDVFKDAIGWLASDRSQKEISEVIDIEDLK